MHACYAFALMIMSVKLGEYQTNLAEVDVSDESVYDFVCELLLLRLAGGLSGATAQGFYTNFRGVPNNEKDLFCLYFPKNVSNIQLMSHKNKEKLLPSKSLHNARQDQNNSTALATCL